MATTDKEIKMRKLDKHEANGVPYRSYSDNFDDALRFGHQHWLFDSVPVTPQLARFVTEFAHRNQPLVPSFKEYTTARTTAPTGGDSYHVYSKISLALADTPDVLMGTLWVEKDPESTTGHRYFVSSDRIINDRYKSWNENYRIKSSKDFKKAVKIAKQYVVPISFREMCHQNQEALKTASMQINGPASEKLREATRMNGDFVRMEIEHMIRCGYTPLTKEFGEALKLIETEGEELLRTSNYKPRKAFVWLKTNKALYQVDGEDERVATTVEDLPEDIRNKIAVLQIGENKSAIMDVGIKIDSTKYWVFL